MNTNNLGFAMEKLGKVGYDVTDDRGHRRRVRRRDRTARAVKRSAKFYEAMELRRQLAEYEGAVIA